MNTITINDARDYVTTMLKDNGQRLEDYDLDIAAQKVLDIATRAGKIDKSIYVQSYFEVMACRKQ